MTVKELAVASEVAFASLRRYLAGERHIDVAVLAALCEALAIEPGQIVERAALRLSRAPEVPGSAAQPDLVLDDGTVVEFKGGRREYEELIERRSRALDEALAMNDDPDAPEPQNRNRILKKDYSSFEDADEAARDEDREKPKID